MIDFLDAFALCGCGSKQTNPNIQRLTDGWLNSSPKRQGLERAALTKLDSANRAGEYEYIDRILSANNHFCTGDAKGTGGSGHEPTQA